MEQIKKQLFDVINNLNKSLPEKMRIPVPQNSVSPEAEVSDKTTQVSLDQVNAALSADGTRAAITEPGVVAPDAGAVAPDTVAGVQNPAGGAVSPVPSDAEKKAKIRIAVLFAAAFGILGYDYIFPSQNENPEGEVVAESTEAPVKAKKKKSAETENQVATEIQEPAIAKEDPTPVEATPVATPDVVATPDAIATAEVPVEVNQAAAPTSEIDADVGNAAPAGTDSNSIVTETPPADIASDVATTSGQDTPAEPATNVTSDSPVVVENSEVAADDSGAAESKSSVGEKLDELVSEVDKEAAAIKAKEEAEKKNIKYTAPPDYEQLGRGLVYNCKGKHWACIDKDGYLACAKNQKWARIKGKKPECVEVNVYSGVGDCRTVQLYNINTLAPTDFCKKK